MENFKIGDLVEVTKDDGSKLQTTVKYGPWELGHKQWVIGLEGIRGGYNLSRVKLLKSEKKI